MTRRTYLLLNGVTGRMIGRGSLRACRVQREFWTLMYAKAALPFVPVINLASQLTLVNAARNAGALALALLLLARPVSAQTRYWEPSEVLGGAAYNVALRIPMSFAPKPYRGAIPRLVVFTLGSLFYESFLDHGHEMRDSVGTWTSTGQMQMDIKNRQIGYLLTEAVVLGVTWIVRRVR